MRFEEGKTYGALDSSFNPITIVKRTPKTIIADNGVCRWRMLVRVDSAGGEYAIDSAVPKRWREAYTYSAWLEQ